MKRLIKVASVVALMALLSGCIISPRHDNGWHRGGGGGYHGGYYGGYHGGYHGGHHRH